MHTGYTYDDPPVDDGLREWLSRRLTQTLTYLRDWGPHHSDKATDAKYIGGGPLTVLEDQDLMRRVIETLVSDPCEIAEWSEDDQYDPENRESGDYTGRWYYRREWVVQDLLKVISECQEAGMSLEDQVHGILTGTLPGKGVKEPFAGELPGLPYGVAAGMQIAAAARRAKWPRQCKVCGGEFRPERSGLRRCQPCRGSKRTATAGRTHGA